MTLTAESSFFVHPVWTTSSVEVVDPRADSLCCCRVAADTTATFAGGGRGGSGAVGAPVALVVCATAALRLPWR